MSGRLGDIVPARIMAPPGMPLLVPIMGCLVAVALAMRYWGAWWPFAPVVAVFGLDALLIARGAATWRREEVMARR